MAAESRTAPSRSRVRSRRIARTLGFALLLTGVALSAVGIGTGVSNARTELASKWASANGIGGPVFATEKTSAGPSWERHIIDQPPTSVGFALFCAGLMVSAFSFSSAEVPPVKSDDPVPRGDWPFDTSD